MNIFLSGSTQHQNQPWWYCFGVNFRRQIYCLRKLKKNSSALGVLSFLANQGVKHSPLLFNIFIADIVNKFETALGWCQKLTLFLNRSQFGCIVRCNCIIIFYLVLWTRQSYDLLIENIVIGTSLIIILGYEKIYVFFTISKSSPSFSTQNNNTINVNLFLFYFLPPPHRSVNIYRRCTLSANSNFLPTFIDLLHPKLDVPFLNKYISSITIVTFIHIYTKSFPNILIWPSLWMKALYIFQLIRFSGQ